ncbi:hypothetical protein TESG_08309 [Trichophyton tonsurans CBS 112818]|uniref:Uncharacterized protein n=1 Tax=Trichophyton tonsurans (strain CBS 112818) TaxID=647933 RepID=F2RRS2_TRIT1|nr:hypothetical protein TESG_08309 [Trichophyton tonsurans CBS 112818]
MGIPLDYTPPASRSRPSAGSGVRVSAEAGSKPPTDPTAAARSSIRRSPHPHPQSSRRLSRLQTGRRTATIRDLRDRHLIFDPVTRTIDRDRSSDRELPLPRIARNPVADHATGSPDSAEAPAGLSRREIGRRLLRDSTPTQTQNPAQPQSESNTPADSSAPTASSFTLENEAAGLQLLHDTLNLLSRRDDIPDEWWATAGLTRIINRELNRELSREQNAE